MSRPQRTMRMLPQCRVVRQGRSNTGTGRNSDDILRVVDSLPLTDVYKVATPVNWTDCKPVIIAPSQTQEEARQRFPGGWKEPKPYLRAAEQRPVPCS